MIKFENKWSRKTSSKVKDEHNQESYKTQDHDNGEKHKENRDQEETT